jgi:hypothetical protein
MDPSTNPKRKYDPVLCVNYMIALYFIVDDSLVSQKERQKKKNTKTDFTPILFFFFFSSSINSIFVNEFNSLILNCKVHVTAAFHYAVAFYRIKSSIGSLVRF